MSENMEVMAGDMSQPKKVAFANRKYSNEERRQRDEEELEQMLKVQSGQVDTEEEVEAEPKGAEEKSFKKRYGDLRRHMQQKEQEWSEKLEQFERQLKEATRKEIKLPKSDDDIEAWSRQYPDVAAIVETIAIKKAREQAADLEDRVKAVDEMRISASREKAEVELMRLHPDFDDIRDSDDFHDWAEEQPEWIQKALYENDTDSRSAARAIDLYKADRNIKTSKKDNKDAARSVNTRSSRSRPETDETSSYLTESAVAKMSAREYEKHADEIMEAIRSGKFIYDVSGSAR